MLRVKLFPGKAYVKLLGIRHCFILKLMHGAMDRLCHKALMFNLNFTDFLANLGLLKVKKTRNLEILI